MHSKCSSINSRAALSTWSYLEYWSCSNASIPQPAKILYFYSGSLFSSSVRQRSVYIMNKQFSGPSLNSLYRTLTRFILIRFCKILLSSQFITRAAKKCTASILVSMNFLLISTSTRLTKFISLSKMILAICVTHTKFCRIHMTSFF